MAITITATPGSASANSFVTELEFIAFLAARLTVHSGATVTGSTCSETEKAALLEATRDLCLETFRGYRTDAVQVLEWPREGCPNPDAPWPAEVGTSGVPEYADTVVPNRVKRATMELALQYCLAKATGLDLATPPTSEGVRRTKVDAIEKEYFEGGRSTRGVSRFPRVQKEIQPLLKASGLGLAVVRQ